MTAPTPEQMRALADEVLERVAADRDGDLDFADRIMTALRAAADQLEAVQEALARHPKCDKYDEDDVVSCGWKSAVRDITWSVSHD